MGAFAFDQTAGMAPRERNFDLLPAGWYTARVIEAGVAPLKSGNGSALKLTFEIMSEGYVNRRLWANLNVSHNNPEAQRIGQEQLLELKSALGISGPVQDTNQLVGKPIEVKVKVRKSNDPQYEDSNEPAGYRALKGGAPTGFGQSSFTPPSAGSFTPPVAPAVMAGAAAAGNTPPWLKK